MRSLFQLLLLLASAIGISGCDGFSLDQLRPGISTAQEVRDRLGPPAAEWPNPDRTTIWEYPRGPAGVECWQIVLDDRGILLRIDQALTEENFARIEKGWSEEQVRRVLGKPGSETTFPLKPERVWEWRVAPKSPGSQAFFHVHFGTQGELKGRVVGTSRRELSVP